MPRVSIKKKEYMNVDLYRWIEGEARKKHITQSMLGKSLGCSQQVISRKLKTQGLSTYELICIFSLFDTDGETITRLLKE